MQLWQRIERHIQATGITATRLGREAAGDPNLVGDLRRGREVGATLAARIGAWLDRRERPRP